MNSRKWFLLTDLSQIEVLIVTVGKMCIHRSRLKSVKPSVEAMLQSLQLEASKECHIAKEKQKVDAFEQRWGGLRRPLT